ncbi:trypco2 family protein [Streptomyces sp. 8N706]|uniref:trypco2 family protein n=1 Tax=Streptomyces sp. 8N706 TaxID=3457416 RepID=UPI003FD34E2C
MSQEPWAELAEAISAVRSELERAMETGNGKKIQFKTGPVEMEFVVDVRKDAEARAKVMVLPWSAEAKGGYATGRMSRIVLTLQPVDEKGEDSTINAHTETRPE